MQLIMSEAFQEACRNFGVTDEGLFAALKRSGLEPRELLTIDTTTSSRNFRVSYLNKAGEKKWAHLFVIPQSLVGRPS